MRFASDGASRRFDAATTAGLRQPAAIRPVVGRRPSSIPDGADLIIVTVPQFRAALEPLWPPPEGWAARAVVDVDEIYDTFKPR